MRYPAYSAVKPSGYVWAGDVPSHWRMLALKRTSRIRYGLGQPPKESEDGLPLLRATNISHGRITTEGMLYVDPRDVPPGRDAELRAEDILVVRSGAYTGDSAIVPRQYAGAIAGYDMVVTVRSQCPSFFAWEMLSPEVNALQFGLFKSRAAQPHLNAEELGETVFVVPPYGEQKIIATFLDHKAALIDDLIADRERQIELIQEYRTAIISRAVTKGLDPNVPMKNSGVEWLGEVPEHWRLAKLGYLARILSGSTPRKENEEYWGGDIPWVSPKDMKRRWIDSAEDSITEKAVVETGIKIVTPPVILIVVRGMILAHSFPVGITTVPVTINQDMKALVLDDEVLHRDFFAYWLEGNKDVLLRYLVDEAAHGTKAVRTDRWKTFPIYHPSVQEQRAIASFIDSETAKIDTFVAKVRESIGKLREYRQSLISAAVTGKIDVRGWKPSSETAEESLHA